MLNEYSKKLNQATVLPYSRYLLPVKGYGALPVGLSSGKSSCICLFGQVEAAQSLGKAALELPVVGPLLLYEFPSPMELAVEPHPPVYLPVIHHQRVVPILRALAARNLYLQRRQRMDLPCP